MTDLIKRHLLCYNRMHERSNHYSVHKLRKNKLAD